MSRRLVAVRVGAGFVGLATLFSWWASPDRLDSLPWSVITLVGAALVVGASGAWGAKLRRHLTDGRLTWLFLIAGLISVAATLLTTRWPAHKLSWLEPVYAALPSVRAFSWAREGLQPNQTGGFLAVCTAFAAGVASSPSSSARRRRAALALAVAGSIIVFMTGSRAAMAGLVLLYLIMAVVRTRRLLWAWACGAVVFGVGLFASGLWVRVLSFFVQDESLNTKLASRLDIWSSALRAIQDHFFTGIGLGVFNQVIPARYPYHIVGLSFPVSQAHNLFLDIALAIGVPGLVGFVLLLAGSAILAGGHLKSHRLTSPVVLGIIASIFVFVVFGATDSISLSVPTSFIVWLWASTLVIIDKGDRKASVITSDV